MNVDNHGILYREGGPREMMIETLKSTDEGVAFIIEYGGKTIYFAGDLHWWSWMGESEADAERREAEYKLEMEKIRGRHFDTAFVVLDPRQEETLLVGHEYIHDDSRCRCCISDAFLEGL